MRFSIMAILLVILLILSGCKNGQRAESGGEYWITGLTLPDGSTVVTRTENALSKDDESILREAARNGTFPELERPVDKVLSVNFDCPAGWNALCGHVDTCLKAQAYSEFSQNSKLQEAAGDPRIAELLSSGKMYTKSGGDYCVELLKVAVMGTKLPPDMGEFMLTVYRLK